MKFVVQYPIDEGLPELPPSLSKSGFADAFGFVAARKPNQVARLTVDAPLQVDAAATGTVSSPGFFQSALVRRTVVAGIASAVGLATATPTLGWHSTQAFTPTRHQIVGEFSTGPLAPPPTVAASLSQTFYQSLLSHTCLHSGMASSAFAPVTATTYAPEAAFSISIARPKRQAQFDSLPLLGAATPRGWDAALALPAAIPRQPQGRADSQPLAALATPTSGWSAAFVLPSAVPRQQQGRLESSPLSVAVTPSGWSAPLSLPLSLPRQPQGQDAWSQKFFGTPTPDQLGFERFFDSARIKPVAFGIDAPPLAVFTTPTPSQFGFERFWSITTQKPLGPQAFTIEPGTQFGAVVPNFIGWSAPFDKAVQRPLASAQQQWSALLPSSFTAGAFGWTYAFDRAAIRPLASARQSFDSAPVQTTAQPRSGWSSPFDTAVVRPLRASQQKFTDATPLLQVVVTAQPALATASFQSALSRTHLFAGYASSVTKPVITQSTLAVASFHSALSRTRLFAGFASSVTQPIPGAQTPITLARSTFGIIVRRPAFELRLTPPAQAAIPDITAASGLPAPGFFHSVLGRRVLRAGIASSVGLPPPSAPGPLPRQAFFHSVLTKRILRAGAASSVGLPPPAITQPVIVPKTTFSLIVRRPTFSIRQMPPEQTAIPLQTAGAPVTFFQSALSRRILRGGHASAVGLPPPSITQPIIIPKSTFSVIVRRPTFQLRLAPIQQAAVPLPAPTGWSTPFDKASIKPVQRAPLGGFQPLGKVSGPTAGLPGRAFFHSALARSSLRGGMASSVATTLRVVDGWQQPLSTTLAVRRRAHDFAALGLKVPPPTPITAADGWNRAFFDKIAIKALVSSRQAFDALGLNVPPPTPTPAQWGEVRFIGLAHVLPLRPQDQQFSSFQPQGQVVSTIPPLPSIFFDRSLVRPVLNGEPPELLIPVATAQWGFAQVFAAADRRRTNAVGATDLSALPIAKLIAWGFEDAFAVVSVPRRFTAQEIASIARFVAPTPTTLAACDFGIASIRPAKAGEFAALLLSSQIAPVPSGWTQAFDHAEIAHFRSALQKFDTAQLLAVQPISRVGFDQFFSTVTRRPLASAQRTAESLPRQFVVLVPGAFGWQSVDPVAVIRPRPLHRDGAVLARSATLTPSSLATASFDRAVKKQFRADLQQWAAFQPRGRIKRHHQEKVTIIGQGHQRQTIIGVGFKPTEVGVAVVNQTLKT